MRIFECSDIKIIRYQGTKEQWNAIFKRDDWDSGISSYTIYCTDGEINK